MRNRNCIYCGAKFTGKRSKHAVSKEHAFPKGLMQPNADGWTLTSHVCRQCNSELGELDDVITSQSEIGLIHNEFECSQSRGKPSFYNEVRYGNPPLRIFGNLVGDDNHLVIIEPRGSTNFKDIGQVRTVGPMPSQIILTQWDSDTTLKAIVEENRFGFDVRISSVHKENDVYQIGPHVHVFGPIAAKHYYDNPSEFACRYLNADMPEKALTFLLPEDSELLSKAKNFGQFIGKSELTQERIEPGWLPQNHEIVIVGHADYFRGIAKIAFHCYLYRNQNRYTGKEPMFDEIKAFIHKGERDSSLVEKGVSSEYTPLSEHAVVLPGGCEIAHVLRFLENGDNIVCIIEFFIGAQASSAFSTILAGCYEESLLVEVNRWKIPYKVLPNHPMLKRIVNPSNYTIIDNPSNYSLIWRLR